MSSACITRHSEAVLADLLSPLQYTQAPGERARAVPGASTRARGTYVAVALFVNVKREGLDCNNKICRLVMAVQD